MIMGIGIDSVDSTRFAQWHTYNRKKLLRIFSEVEIAYCQENALLAAQRFAVRFAAREALFKAMTQAFPGHSIPLLTLCRATHIIQAPGHAPRIELTQELLYPYGLLNHQKTLSQLNIFASLTHTKNMATAFIILEKTHN